mmetsp:Transcript_5793/g.15707  ORF Transcript_5793/g.15707 Transcript_5793/m.15707 type:complete len:80 (+) Transcript_5793:59-298(+)
MWDTIQSPAQMHQHDRSMLVLCSFATRDWLSAASVVMNQSIMRPTRFHMQQGHEGGRRAGRLANVIDDMNSNSAWISFA